jgi:hypothetical protein
VIGEAEPQMLDMGHRLLHQLAGSECPPWLIVATIHEDLFIRTVVGDHGDSAGTHDREEGGETTAQRAPRSGVG